VAIYPDDTTDEVLLRRMADQRMYEQKRQIQSASKSAEMNFPLTFFPLLHLSNTYLLNRRHHGP
jgi:hypothetical protein